MLKRVLRLFFANLAVLLVYVASARLGLSLATVNPSVTPVWPPAGIAIALAILFGKRYWPGIWAGAFIANFLIQHHIATSAGIAFGNLLEAILAAMFVNYFAGGRYVFYLVAHTFRYVLYAAMLSTGFCASLGTTILCLQHQADWTQYGSIWMTWWLGDMVSALVVAPLLITWAERKTLSVGEAIEGTVLLGLAAFSSALVFGRPPSTGAVTVYPLEYLTILPLLWAAFRFPQRGAATVVAVTSAIAVAGTLAHHGPFTTNEENKSLLILQAFLGTMAVTGLVLSSIVAERRDVLALKQESERRARELAAREQNARREAELANRAKDNFLAVLSHELRTPLTPVLLTASMLERRDGLPPDVLEDIKSIRGNIELEARLIDDLLDLTRIARGKLQLTLQTIDLHAAVAAAITICQQPGRARIESELVADEHFVRGDPARLQQVFWNLLTNAQKFTPPNGLIRVRSANPSAGMVRIHVRDNGIGIDPEILPKLFNAFEQGEGGTTRKYGGLGLGLAISRALVVAHGGNLSASSAGKGQGATFSVELATVPAPAPTKRPDSARMPTTRRALNVLLVEDDKATQKAMSVLLRQMGHQLSAADNIKSALGFAAQSRYDLVISDLGLPDGSGHDLMREIQKRYGTSGIALSGYGMEEDLKRSAEAGFAEHLIKPVTPEKLEAAIAKLTG